MSEKPNQTKSKTKLTLLVLMFLLPVGGAWYLVFFTDFARDGAGAEYGNLIKPPRQLENVQLTRIDERSTEQSNLHGKWSMLFVAKGACETICEENLYRLRQIRLATGREMLRVQRVVVINEAEAPSLSEYLRNNFPGQMYALENEVGTNFLNQFQDLESNDKMGIFLIDPRGFLMMRYSSDADPSGIIRDLSRLLRISS